MTKNPCPGCGGKFPHRRAAEVCYECKSLLKEAKARRAQINRLKETEPAKLPFASHCLATIYHFREPFQEESPDSIVKQFVFDLVALIGEPVSWNNIKFPPAEAGDRQYLIRGSSGCSSGGETYWQLPRGLGALLNKLYAAVQAGAEIAFQEGEEEGRNLIKGLATGETSIDEFNKASVGKVANKRRKK